MTPRQFVAPNARAALALIRKEIGPDAVILSNRTVAEGVAVTAIAESALEDFNERNPIPVTETNDVAMSTVKFERFAKQRQAQHSEQNSGGMPTKTELSANSAMPENPATSTRMQLHQSEPVPIETRAHHGESLSYMQSMVEELRQMRGFIRQQFSALAWVDGVRRTPAQARLLKRMIENGFSAKLARIMVSRLPDDFLEDQADRWLQDSLVRNLRTACFENGMLQQGGVYALVGPTGVGKTTSTAKIAARYALEHGPDSVGLISADAYRVAGQEQLARYGRMIGVKVLTARDASELAELLIRLQDKSLVLIDTAGLGQRDPRVADLLEFISQGPVRRLVVMSASAQAEAIDETLDAYRADESAGVLLTKTDEACRLGGALDTLIRHRLPLHAIGNGQRVPEDWMAADPDKLIAQALENTTAHGSEMPDIDLTMLMQRIEPVTVPSGSQQSDDLDTGKHRSIDNV
jgi:flagellar biosynthesis protein FlhF